MRDIVINLLLVGTIPVIFLQPHVGVLTYYWVTYMSPQSLTWNQPPVAWAKVIALSTLAVWLFSREPKKIPLNGVTITLGALLFWAMISTLFAQFPAGALRELTDLAKVMAMAMAAVVLLNSRRRLHALIWMIVIAVGYYTVKGGIFTVITGGTSLVIGPRHSQYFNTNEMARAVIMVIPLIFYLYLQSAHRLVRYAMLAACMFSGLALVGTNSRGGFVAFAAIALYAVLISRRRIWFVAGGALIAVGALTLLSTDRLDFWTNRISTISEYEQDGSFTGRVDAWRYALELAGKRPVVGGGLGAFKGFERDSHSNYFGILGELGYVGLAIYLLLAVLVFRTGTQIIQQTRDHPDLYWARDLALVVKMSLVGYFVGGFVISHAYFELYYTLIAILVATKLVVAKELAGSSPQRKPVPQFGGDSLRPQAAPPPSPTPAPADRQSGQ